MAIDTDRIVASAKTKLAALLIDGGLDSAAADDAAEKAIDNLGVAIIEAIIEEVTAHAETSGGETIA